MMFCCYICNISIDRFHTVWLPERMENNNRVYPICFDCSDNFIMVYQARLVDFLKRRELGKKSIINIKI